MNLYYAQISFETGPGRGRYCDYYIYSRSLENAKDYAMGIVKSLDETKEKVSLTRLEQIEPREGMIIG